MPDRNQLVTDRIEGLVPYRAGKPIEELARERGLSDIVKLASNENAIGPSPRALEAASEAMAQVHRYPDGEGFRLRSAIAAHLGVEVAEVIHGNGSNELLELLVRTFTTPQHHIVFGKPAFSMYPVIAAAHNVDSTAVPTTTDLVHDLDAMLSAIRENTKLVIIDNPNNPTGTYVPQAKVRKFLASVPHQVIVVMDEAYFEYATAEDYPNSLRLRDARERLVVLRTFAKAYGLAGFRVGYGVGPAQIIGYMNRLRAPFNVGVISQEAAIAGLSDQRHVERAVELNTRERERMAKELSTRGHGVFPSQTNFLFVDFGTSSAKLYDQLLDQGVIVRPIPGFETCLRITIGTERENDRLLSSLDKVLRR